MAHEPRHDVVIVGGGAVGLLLACLLARRGIDAVVLERRTSRPERSRAIGIHPPGVARSPSRARARGAGPRPSRSSTGGSRARAGCSARCRSPGAGTRAVAAAARDRGGAASVDSSELRPGALAPRHRGARRARPRHARRGRRQSTSRAVASRCTVGARYAIAADGVRSGIREQLGIAWRSHRGSRLLRHGRHARRHRRARERPVALRACGVVESFPMPGGLRRWVAWVRRPPTTPTAEQLARSCARGSAAPSTRGPHPSRARSRPASTWPSGCRRAASRSPATPRTRSAPIGGQGMNLGWLDAMRLDHDLAAALAVGAPEAFDTYDRCATPRRPSHAAGRVQHVDGRRPTRACGCGRATARVRVLGFAPFRALLARAFTMRWL